MRVLLSAYACEPEAGSEPEVGYRTLLAAASAHDVWVLTRSHHVPLLEDRLRHHELRDRVRLVGIDLTARARAVKRRTGLAGLYWFYDRWQALAARHAVALDDEVDFDVVHHATFATSYARAGVAAVAKPFVWGPVGGGVNTPTRLLGELGVRGLVRDAVRFAVRGLSEQSPPARAAARQASVIIAQNPQTAARIPASGAVEVYPNGTVVAVEARPNLRRQRGKVVFAGRLVALKAAALAVRTMRYVRHPEARLLIYGDGPQAGRVQRLSRRWGVDDRVELVGSVPRQSMLDEIATADVLLHPALHEEGGLAVAEALSLGTPVVCLDRGGPPVMAGLWQNSRAIAVRPGTPTQTAIAMAAAIDAFIADPAPVPGSVLQPERTFAEVILSAYERAAALGSTENRR